MARRFKSLDGTRLGELPSTCAGCMFWETGEPLPKRCGAACDPEQLAGWIDYVRAQWGECGRIAYEDGEVLGFVKYAPAAFFPQVAHFPGTPSDDAVLLACLHVGGDVRHLGLGKVLLHAALRDLASRGARCVEAYAVARHPSDIASSPVVTVDFLLKQGFTVVRPHPEYPLMRLEIKSLAAWTENLEAVLESLKLPMPVRNGVPAPTPR
jgi:GNAT superfamily N-acetyltransferase